MAELRLPPVNVIIRDTLKARLALLAPASADSVGSESGAVPPAPPVLALSLTEFDDVRYLLTAEADAPARVALSIALPSDPAGERGAAALPEGSLASLRETYAPYGVPAPTPAPGYALTLQLDLAAFPAGEEARDAEAERCASVRAVVMGAPLRALLAPLAAGTPAPDTLVTIPHRPGEAFFAKRSDAEAVTVVYPMRFKDAADATIARTFLAQFAEARRAAALNTAPSAAYSPSAPPGELRGAPAALAEGANGGYVSLVIFRRHVGGGGKKLEAAVWSLGTFYAFVAYHIKCSKAYMHSSMRRRTGSLLQVLNRAKPDVEKEKKTASGRTFRAKAAR